MAPFPHALAMLRLVPDLTVRPIASSCCGMAGAFGYQAETQAVSQAMAEAGLLPALRAAAPEDVIVADGTSCRHQIADLSDRTAIHAVRLLDRALIPGEPGVPAPGNHRIAGLNGASGRRAGDGTGGLGRRLSGW